MYDFCLLLLLTAKAASGDQRRGQLCTNLVVSAVHKS
jgi:hypothetical protein